MPEVCEGGGEAQGGGYGGSASCGSAPRRRTLFQARLRECKFCMQRGGGLHVPSVMAVQTLSVAERLAGFGEDSGQLHDRFSLRSFWIDTRGDTRRTKDTAEVRGETESTDVDVASPCFG